MDVVFGKVDGLGAKLDALTAAMHEPRGSTGLALRDILSFVRDGAVLFSLVVGGILYLANATNGRSVSDLETRMTRLEAIIGMATVRRPTPGAWVPDTLGMR